MNIFKDKIDERLYQYLIFLMDNNETKDIHDYLVHSDIFFEPNYSSSFRDDSSLIIVTHPEIYKKYNNKIVYFNKFIVSKLNDFSNLFITSIKTIPNLSKFQILNNGYTPIFTPWEEINNYQNIIIDQLRTASEPIHFQNIGNTGRTIMKKISGIVFNPEIHVAPHNIDTSEEKFKNRLHTYIKTVLEGRDNKEIRDYALSLVDVAESSIELSNKLTHSLNADSFIAESCVISIISVISLIKTISNKD